MPQTGYIYHGKHYDKLGSYKDLAESLDKSVPEITRVPLLRPELPGWFHKGCMILALWQGMEKKEKGKKKLVIISLMCQLH